MDRLRERLEETEEEMMEMRKRYESEVDMLNETVKTLKKDVM